MLHGTKLSSKMRSASSLSSTIGRIEISVALLESVESEIGNDMRDWKMAFTDLGARCSRKCSISIEPVGSNGGAAACRLSRMGAIYARE